VPTRTDLQRLIAIVTDLVREVGKFIRVDSDLAQRYSRSMEELDGIRLALEEQREILQDHFIENSHWANELSRRIDRLERYTILVRMFGGNAETIQVEAVVSREHIQRALREELTTQQELILQYQKNIDRVRLKVARYGETIPLMNELDDYQKQIEKAAESMSRIRESLNE